MPGRNSAPMTPKRSRSRMRAVVYFRHVAPDRQKRSVTDQRADVRKWAAVNGLKIVGEFAD